jgi:hypothetical protein
VLVEGEKLVQSLEIPVPTIDWVRWAPSSDALEFVRRVDGVANIWRLPINGKPAEQLTRFPAGAFAGVAEYGWTADGSHLVFTRVQGEPSHVLLIKNFR